MEIKFLRWAIFLSHCYTVQEQKKKEDVSGLPALFLFFMVGFLEPKRQGLSLLKLNFIITPRA